MTSQPSSQTIAIHILPNISRSQRNQAMTFAQSIEYNKINNFLQRLCRKWDRKTSSESLLFFKKALYEVEASGLKLSFNIFR